MKWWNARSTRTKGILIATGLVLVLAMLGSGSEEPTDTAAVDATASPTARPAAAATAAATPTAAPTPTPRPSPITLSGRGQTATDVITPPGPVALARFTHAGTRNFVVYIVRPGAPDDLLINAIGSYEGVRPITGAEPLRLNIEADGAWTVTLEAIDVGAQPPFSGRGDAASDLFTPPASGAWEFAHDGTRNFIVYAHCAGGSQLMQNRIGAFEGSQIITFGRGPCFWEVRADGAWSLRPR